MCIVVVLCGYYLIFAFDKDWNDGLLYKLTRLNILCYIVH